MKSASCPPSQADRSRFTASRFLAVPIATAEPPWPLVMFRYSRLCALLAGLALVSESAFSGQNFAVIQAVRGDQNHLFVPISINSRSKSWWVVDTGAPISAISESAARKASVQGPEIVSKIPASVRVEGQDRQIVIAQKMVSEGFDFGEQTLVVLRLDALERERMQRLPESSKNGGILGLPILQRYGALINCRTRQIFLNREGGPLPVQRKAYERMGFTYVPIKITPENHLEAVGTIGTGEYSFLIDTGAANTLIMASIRQKEKVSFYDERTRLVGVHDFKNPSITSGSLPSFRLGDQDLSNSFVGFANLNLHQSEFSRPFGGIIGAEVLWDQRAIIDVGNRALYLKADRQGRSRS
jgi:predicted aspartyl protease